MRQKTAVEPDGPGCFRVRVGGIPAVARITYYVPPDPGRPAIFDRRTADLVDPGEPGFPAYVEWQLHDRKGYPAQWLEDRLTNDDIIAVDKQILDMMGRSN